jgi:hypothetical protein
MEVEYVDCISQTAHYLDISTIQELFEYMKTMRDCVLRIENNHFVLLENYR